MLKLQAADRRWAFLFLQLKFLNFFNNIFLYNYLYLKFFVSKRRYYHKFVVTALGICFGYALISVFSNTRRSIASV